MSVSKTGKPEGTGARAEAEGFWSKHQSDVLLALLFVYVILLGIGTVAELFHIESILRWPIYR
jgi:hypothetical protein